MPERAPQPANAWDIDRWLLVGLGRDEWDAAVRDVQSRLTDDVIDAAVRRLPPEHYAIAGPGLVAALKRRRDDLAAPAEGLYLVAVRYPDPEDSGSLPLPASSVVGRTNSFSRPDATSRR